MALHDCSSILVLVSPDHFSNDPAVTTVNATGHQLFTFCRSICAKEMAQILELLKSCTFCCRTIHVCALVCVHRLLNCSQDYLTFWVVWNAWSRVRHELFHTLLERLIKAAMKQKRVSLTEVSVRSRLTSGADEFWLKQCVWAAATNWSVSSGLISH